MRSTRSLSPNDSVPLAFASPGPNSHASTSLSTAHNNITYHTCFCLSLSDETLLTHCPLADQIARQVEDPGLKHSSQTHVGLELSIRHAAEFFAFYICRFILADLGLLMDKFVKRGTEWALS